MHEPVALFPLFQRSHGRAALPLDPKTQSGEDCPIDPAFDAIACRDRKEVRFCRSKGNGRGRKVTDGPDASHSPQAIEYKADTGLRHPNGGAFSRSRPSPMARKCGSMPRRQGDPRRVSNEPAMSDAAKCSSVGHQKLSRPQNHPTSPQNRPPSGRHLGR